jgi:hypothetical protein
MAVTVHESLKARNRHASVRKSPVFYVFMREGAVYYLAMATVVSKCSAYHQNHWYNGTALTHEFAF